MTQIKQLLIVSNTPSTNTQLLADAAVRGASHEDINGVEVKHVTPFEATPEDVMNCDAILLGTTENFGYMSGAMKDFFDRIFYPCLEHTEAKPYAIFIRAGAVERSRPHVLATSTRWLIDARSDNRPADTSGM